MSDDKSFESAIGDVEPLNVAERASIPQGSSQPDLRQLAAREKAVTEPPPNYLRDFLDEDSLVKPDHQFKWQREGTQISVFQYLLRGVYESEVIIDLHHRTIKEAHTLIWDFIASAIENRHRNVLIVHGLGEKSTPQARLKSYVGQALVEHDDVFGFCSAPSELGGVGATLVWLRKSEVAKQATRERIQSRQG